jgi:hypothetical protein
MLTGCCRFLLAGSDYFNGLRTLAMDSRRFYCQQIVDSTRHDADYLVLTLKRHTLLLHRSPGSDLTISAANTGLKLQLILRAKPQPVPANLSAIFRVASIAVPASDAILRFRAST